MLSFIVFGIVALISIIILLSLSIRHGVNSVSAWIGSLFIFLGAIVRLSAETEQLMTISYIIFGLGNALFLLGIYTISERFIKKTALKSTDMQAKTISDILEVAASRESLIELLNYSLDRFLEIFTLNSGAIHIFHRAKNRLVMGSYRGLIPAHAKKLELLEPGQTAIGRAVQNKRVLIIRDLSVSPDFQFFGGRAEGYSFLAVAPILVEERCWGVITLMGRQKYHRGMFTIDQLEQFGQKLGQALVLGRENRRMVAAFKHISNILELYGRVFNYVKRVLSSNIAWNDVGLFKALNMYKSQPFDNKAYAVIKFTARYGQCLYLKDDMAAASNGINEIYKRIPLEELNTSQRSADYFSIDEAELAGLLPPALFNGKRLAAYGYLFDSDFYAMVLVDNCEPEQLKNYEEDLAIIGNLLTLSYSNYKSESSAVKPDSFDDEIKSEVIGDLTSLLTDIFGSSQMINEQIISSDEKIKSDDIQRWLDNIEKSAHRGIGLINRLGFTRDPNQLIQSVISRKGSSVAFYPGTKLPEIRTNPDEFMQMIDNIINEAVTDKKSIRIKSSPQNNSIALTIEGPVKQDFPTSSLKNRLQRHNIVLNIMKEDELENESEAVAEDRSIAALNALTVEDKPVIIDLLEDFFEKLGHQNVTLTSGQKGLAYVKSANQKGEHVDVAVIDMTLEDMSGLELCRQIKEIDKSIYAIIISSWGVNLHTHTLKDAGVDAVLHKPFRLEQFRNALPRKELSDAAEI